MKQEPVIISQVLGQLVGVVINVLVLSGFTIDPDLEAQLALGIQAVCALIAGIVGRSIAWAPNSVEAAKADAVAEAFNHPSNPDF